MPPRGRLAALSIATTAFVLGCGASRHAALVERVEHDLGCPAERIELERERDRDAVLRACGHRVAYVVLCEPGCGWVRTDDPLDPR